MGTQRQATVYVDYQQRAREFSVGDLAYPLAGSATDESQAGRVVAVWPGIGQVDLEFPWGSGRYSVEDLQRVTDIVTKPPEVEHSTVPGGAGTVNVPGGPVKKRAAEAVSRVYHAHVKQALYWASKNRNYRATKTEIDAGKYTCPKCRAEEGADPIHLRPTSYKREDGKSHRLFGCPQCMFLIKRDHILGLIDEAADLGDLGDDGPLDGLQADWDGTTDQGFESVRNVEAAEAAERVLTVVFDGNGDGADSISKMLAYIGKIASGGHSFGIVVDPGDSDYEKSFGFDGDGSDRVLSVELDGKVVEAD